MSLMFSVCYKQNYKRTEKVCDIPEIRTAAPTYLIPKILFYNNIFFMN